MGLAKNWIMEIEEKGYEPLLEDKFVCAELFNDIYLKRYIEYNSHHGKCSYTNKITNVISFNQFLDYIMHRIQSYYVAPELDGLPYSSTFYDEDDECIPGLTVFCGFVTREQALTFDSTEELFEHINLVSNNDEVISDLVGSISNNKWIQKDSAIRSMKEELSDTWQQFSRMIKHSRRFTFYMLPEYNPLCFSSENGLQHILIEISNAISELGLYKKLPENTKLYRCRYINESEEVISFESITSPPDDKASENRMNPIGISMFYGAFDYNTAILEARDSSKPIYMLGEFSTKKDLVILDLTDLPEKGFWNEYWQELAFIYSFCAEVSKPIDPNTELYEYVPTQVFAEYIRYGCKDSDGSRIDGIKFNSSKDAGQNIVLFYNQKQSEDILKLNQLTNNKNINSTPV